MGGFLILNDHTYLTHHHSSPESPIDRDLIACNMGNSLRNKRWGEGEEVGSLRDNTLSVIKNFIM